MPEYIGLVVSFEFPLLFSNFRILVTLGLNRGEILVIVV